MLKNRLWVLLLVVPAAVVAVACADPPAPQKKTATDKKTSTDDTDKDSRNDEITSPRPTPTATAPAAVPAGLADASLPKPPPPSSRPPPPTTKFCQDLNQCCNQLGFLDQIACRLTAGYNDETACGIELAVCAGGGFVGIGQEVGGLFQTNNPECASLSKCCGKFQDQGFSSTANECREWVETANENYCSSQRATYQSYGECF